MQTVNLELELNLGFERDFMLRELGKIESLSVTSISERHAFIQVTGDTIESIKALAAKVGKLSFVRRINEVAEPQG